MVLHLEKSDSNFNRNYLSITHADYLRFCMSYEWNSMSESISKEIKATRPTPLLEPNTSSTHEIQSCIPSVSLSLSPGESNSNSLELSALPATSESPISIARFTAEIKSLSQTTST